MDREKFRNYFKNPFIFKLLMLYELPMAFVAGIKVKRVDDEVCEISVKHRWLNQNPFKSMYFAVQSMAAEMSTGLPLVIETRFSKPSVSTLVLKNKASFSKKAVGLITFRCDQVQTLIQSVKKAQETAEAVTVDLTSVGRDEQGDVVAEFVFTWTLKVKSNNKG